MHVQAVKTTPAMSSAEIRAKNASAVPPKGNNSL